jgi:hypothetical protein
VNLHSNNNTTFGDPKQLESAKLSDLHPASWYAIVMHLLPFFNFLITLATGRLVEKEYCNILNHFVSVSVLIIYYSVFRFCVAWYPICQIPSTAGRCPQTAFLTYHSLGKLVPLTCSADMADGLSPIVCPIVGLLSYKDEVSSSKSQHIYILNFPNRQTCTCMPFHTS